MVQIMDIFIVETAALLNEVNAAAMSHCRILFWHFTVRNSKKWKSSVSKSKTHLTLSKCIVQYLLPDFFSSSWPLPSVILLNLVNFRPYRDSKTKFPKVFQLKLCGENCNHNTVKDNEKGMRERHSAASYHLQEIWSSINILIKISGTPTLDKRIKFNE